MRTWSPDQIAAAAGARLAGPSPASAGPERITIDSRDSGPGALFVGLRGEQVDGGSFACAALAAGAWGVLVSPEHAESARRAQPGTVLAADDPLKALQRLAASWRRSLDVTVIGITGSTGKTTTKDLLLALLAPRGEPSPRGLTSTPRSACRWRSWPRPAETEVLVLEHAMRGAGQIAELAAISQPEVAVIVNIGPVHLELLGSIEAIAATKAELIGALKPGDTAVVPAGEQLLEPYLRDDLEVVRFGPGGDVQLANADGQQVTIDHSGTRIELEVPFSQPHLLSNLLAAVAAARAVGVTPAGRLEVAFSPSRGQRVALPHGVTLIDDCYNANPMSMRAALDDVASVANGATGSRTVAVLGDMLELGEAARRFHSEIGERAGELGIDLLVTVGPLASAIGERYDGEIYSVADAGEAAALVPELLQPGDVVLVKGSRGVGLELVSESLIQGNH